VSVKLCVNSSLGFLFFFLFLMNLGFNGSRFLGHVFRSSDKVKGHLCSRALVLPDNLKIMYWQGSAAGRKKSVNATTG